MQDKEVREEELCRTMIEVQDGDVDGSGDGESKDKSRGC